MKKNILLILLLLPGLLLFSKATIKFRTTTIDFGEIDSGKTVDLKFEFENAGDTPLKIKNVIPSCGCTSSSLEKKEFKPGEKGVIPAKFNSTGFNGKVIKTINVLTDDPENTDVILRITGNIRLRDYPRGEIKPDAISFGRVKIGKTQNRKVTLTNSGTLDLKVIEISCAPEISVAMSAKSVAPGKALDVEISFGPFEREQISTLVKIRTNDTRSPYLFVRVDAEGE